MNILEILKPYCDKKYKVFQEKICSTKYTILGVKIPILRKIARKLLKEYSYQEIINNLNYEYFECIMLEGLLISNVKLTYKEKIKLITKYLPKIDNWAICDIFASELKIVNDYPEDFLLFITDLLKSSKEYYLRFGIVLLLNYYINDNYIDEVLNKLLTIKNDKYYVKMAISWAYSICFIKYFSKTKDFFIQNKNNIDPWIYNKSLQKSRESFRIDKKHKEILQKMKII